MAEPTELIVVLAVVYFLECLQVVPRRAVALQAWWSRRFALRAAGPIGLWRGAALVLGFPLPPMGLTLVVDELPVRLDEDALVGADGTRRPWASLGKMTLRGQQVVIDGATIATLSTEAAALALARALRAVASGEPAQRQQLVDELMHARMDGARARRRVAALRAAVWPLRVAESLLFALLFAGIPLIFFTQLSEQWVAIAAGAGAAWIATLLAYARARRRCFPVAGEGPPRGRLVTLALWPLAAMRASDVLGRYLLHDVDPLAAAALLPPEAFRAAARRALAELRFAREPREGWADERRRRAILRLLRDEKVDAEALFAPPPRDDAAVRGFCPRCRAQYVSERATCASCAGIRVLPLP